LLTPTYMRIENSKLNFYLFFNNFDTLISKIKKNIIFKKESLLKNTPRYIIKQTIKPEQKEFPH